MAATFLTRAKGLFGLPETSATVAAKPAVAPNVAKKPSTAFHAVSVAPGSRCCGAAKEIEGKRFLSSKAPVLPLKDCTRPECTCRYVHHQDRRFGPRRAREMGVAIDGWIEEDKRAEQKRGRRKTDQR
jgi:hypothetical protein